MGHWCQDGSMQIPNSPHICHQFHMSSCHGPRIHPPWSSNIFSLCFVTSPHTDPCSFIKIVFNLSGLFLWQFHFFLKSTPPHTHICHIKTVNQIKCVSFFFCSLWSVYFEDSSYRNYEGKFSSVTQSCPTLCDPMDRSTPGLPVHHQLLEFTQTHVHWVHDAIQPSHPLSSPSPPTLNLSQH